MRVESRGGEQREGRGERRGERRKTRVFSYRVEDFQKSSKKFGLKTRVFFSYRVGLRYLEVQYVAEAGW